MARTEEQWAHHEIDLHLASLADATIPAKATMSCVGYPLTSQYQSDRIMAAQWAVLSAVLGAGRLPPVPQPKLLGFHHRDVLSLIKRPPICLKGNVFM